MGNLRNASDWAALKTSAGQDAIARAFASAAVKILAESDAPATVV